MQMPDGTVVARDKGTPQGSPVSPVLANLFMHYAFDRWMAREFPGCPWERYADDIVAHCDSEGQARHLRAAIADRLGALGLELHPEKTRIVYCKDANRRGGSEHVSFDFLGYTFRGRLARGPAGHFVSFRRASAPRRSRRKACRSGLGTSTVAPGRTCPASPRTSTLRSEAGSTITGPSTAPSCTHSHGASTSILFDGLRKSSSDSGTSRHGPGTGWPRYASSLPSCSLTGSLPGPPTIGSWEPYDRRRSRTVLREREGEIPSRHSPERRMGKRPGRVPRP